MSANSNKPRGIAVQFVAYVSAIVIASTSGIFAHDLVGGWHLLGYVALADLVVVWAVRLTYDLFAGWSGLDHEDWRYRDFRERFPRGQRTPDEP